MLSGEGSVELFLTGAGARREHGLLDHAVCMDGSVDARMGEWMDGSRLRVVGVLESILGGRELATSTGRERAVRRDM